MAFRSQFRTHTKLSPRLVVYPQMAGSQGISLSQRPSQAVTAMLLSSHIDARNLGLQGAGRHCVSSSLELALSALLDLHSMNATAVPLGILFYHNMTGSF